MNLANPTIRIVAAIACVLLLGLRPFGVSAQTLQDLLNARVKSNAEGALAMFGISAIPSETASTLWFDVDSEAEGQHDFVAGQLGGGFTVSDSFPLYLEGYFGWSRYDPKLLLTDTSRRLPLKWTTFSATGAVGWDFAITDDLVFRPMVLVSLGRVQSDTSVVATVIARELGVDISFLRGGGMWVGGAGAALGLAYNHRWEDDLELDVTLRHTHLRLVPIGEDRDLADNADAATTAFWSRLRVPTGVRLFDRPVRGVFEASGSYLPGDQGKVLQTDWLAQVGVGIEVDFSETAIPLLTTTRLTARYTRGEHLEGFSIGVGVSF